MVFCMEDQASRPYFDWLTIKCHFFTVCFLGIFFVVYLMLYSCYMTELSMVENIFEQSIRLLFGIGHFLKH